jgi:endoglucanase
MMKRLYIMLLVALVATTAFSADARWLASQMYPGWNLGNTMEGTGGETSWQSTTTTQAIIDYVRSQGFRSVRIPCSWDIHCDGQGVIDPSWMARVKQIVDYCIADGLYVVLNDHWDNGWIEVQGFSRSTAQFEPVDEAVVTAKIARLKILWTQIALAFKDYDDHLLLSGLNEPFQQYNLFHDRHQELTPILLRYNQAFVDAVRATGGGNAQRTLVCQGPSTSITSTTDSAIGFHMPTDPAGAGHLMVEVHYYEPWDFCGVEEHGKRFWGAERHVADSEYNCTWGEPGHPKQRFSRMKAKFFDHGYPTIIGEYGANWRQIDAFQTQHDASIKAWFRDVTQQAISNGCVPMVWDINSPDRQGERGTMTIINRANLTIFCPWALEGIQEAVKAATWPQ